MQYVWVCEHCGEQAEVTRPVMEREIGPIYEGGEHGVLSGPDCPSHARGHHWVRAYTAPAAHRSQAWVQGGGAKGKP